MICETVGILKTLTDSLRGDAPSLSSHEISRTIEVSRIVLIVGLVFLHYGMLSPETDLQVAGFVIAFVRYFFFAAVPLLSVISGWLFFSFTEGAERALVDRIKRRLFTLYLPLISWNGLILAGLAGLYLLDSTSALLGEINIDFSTAGSIDYVNAVFALTDRPVAIQFWFVRDLFLTVLASPLLWVLLRWAPMTGLGALFLVWIADQDLCLFFRPDVLFFFYVGGLLRIHKAPLEIAGRSALLLLIVYAGLMAGRAMAPFYVDGSSLWQVALLDKATSAARLLGVIACWGVLLQIARSRAGVTLARFSGLSFIIFATHLPLVFQVKISLWQFIPEYSDGWMLVLYVASVAVTVALGVVGGLVLALTFPRIFAFLNGGRLSRDGSRAKMAAARPVDDGSDLDRARGKEAVFRSP